MQTPCKNLDNLITLILVLAPIYWFLPLPLMSKPLSSYQKKMLGYLRMSFRRFIGIELAQVEGLGSRITGHSHVRQCVVCIDYW